MAADFDDLEREVEQTRLDLARTVDALVAKADPRAAVRQRVEAARGFAEVAKTAVTSKASALAEKAGGRRGGSSPASGDGAEGAPPAVHGSFLDGYPTRRVNGKVVAAGAVASLAAFAAVLAMKRRARGHGDSDD